MSHGGADTAITAPRIFDGQAFLPYHSVLLRADTIVGVVPDTEFPATVRHINLQTGTVAPGFIDLQVNGGGDVMFNAATTASAIATICRAHREKGTTGLLPTLISETQELQEKAVAAVQEARAAGNDSVLGLHLEGPFLASGRRGAHSEKKLRELNDRDVDWLCSLSGFPVLLTLAPECASHDQLKRLAAAGLQLSAGHTEASFEQMCAACDSGVTGVTHLFNAMSGLTSRQPGAVGAALDLDRLWAGIIADGHHVHAAAIRLAQRAKPAGKLILVSDAMATVGGNKTASELYGEMIRLEEGKLINAEGRLAGSAIGLIDAVSFAHRKAGLPLEECLRMASLYPAAILGLAESHGSIAMGRRADLVHFDHESFAVLNTWLAGHCVQHQVNKT